MRVVSVGHRLGAARSDESGVELLTSHSGSTSRLWPNLRSRISDLPLPELPQRTPIPYAFGGFSMGGSSKLTCGLDSKATSGFPNTRCRYCTPVTVFRYVSRAS
eukprot:407301-Rhodomonas_salina.3